MKRYTIHLKEAIEELEANSFSHVQVARIAILKDLLSELESLREYVTECEACGTAHHSVRLRHGGYLCMGCCIIDESES